jgi:hypothetical protein
MKAKEFNIKKRDPNWQTMQAKGTSGAAGKHKDKKKAAKQGEVKHKKQVTEGVDELYGLRVGDTVTTEFNGQKVQGDVIDLFPDDMKVELLLRGPESGRTVVVDVRDTEFFEATGDEKFDAMMRQIKKGTKKQATADRRERERQSREQARAAFGPSPADKLSIRSEPDPESEVRALLKYDDVATALEVIRSIPDAELKTRLRDMVRQHRNKGVAEGDDPDEEYLDKVISDLHKDVYGTRPSNEFGLEWMGSSYEEKLKTYKNMLLGLKDDIDEVLAYGTGFGSSMRSSAPRKKTSSMLSIMRAMKDKEDKEKKSDKETVIVTSKDKTKTEASDFGEPKEILSDVLSTLEREVEWPLTDVMEYEEVLRLLAPIKNAINDKLKSIGEAKDLDWGSMSHSEFKRRELEHELAGEEERYQQAMKGDYYLRIDGKIWRKSGTPVVFSGKQAAEKAGMTILRKNPGKKISVVNKPIDESYLELSLEDRIDELKRGTGFLILKFREKELPEDEGRYLIGYGGFGETPDDVRLATAVIKEFKAEKFEDMRRKIFDLFKDKSFVGVEKIKINAPTSLINKYPELEKLFSAAESGEFKKVEPIYSEPKEKVSKKTEKYRIDPVTGKRERIKEPIKYGRGMSGRPGEPGEQTVRFSVTNPRLASMMKDQGLQFNQGKFTVSQSMYKKLLDALRDAEMIRKFGDVTTLIKDKEIIENDETV